MEVLGGKMELKQTNIHNNNVTNPESTQTSQHHLLLLVVVLTLQKNVHMTTKGAEIAKVLFNLVLLGFFVV